MCLEANIFRLLNGLFCVNLLWIVTAKNENLEHQQNSCGKAETPKMKRNLSMSYVLGTKTPSFPYAYKQTHIATVLCAPHRIWNRSKIEMSEKINLVRNINNISEWEKLPTLTIFFLPLPATTNAEEGERTKVNRSNELVFQKRWHKPIGETKMAMHFVKWMKIASEWKCWCVFAFGFAFVVCINWLCYFNSFHSLLPLSLSSFSSLKWWRNRCNHMVSVLPLSRVLL